MFNYIVNKLKFEKNGKSQSLYQLSSIIEITSTSSDVISIVEDFLDIRHYCFTFKIIEINVKRFSYHNRWTIEIKNALRTCSSLINQNQTTWTIHRTSYWVVGTITCSSTGKNKTQTHWSVNWKAYRIFNILIF